LAGYIQPKRCNVNGFDKDFVIFDGRALHRMIEVIWGNNNKYRTVPYMIIRIGKMFMAS
jgi:hypothetical protein